jgi:hypothetical protein
MKSGFVPGVSASVDTHVPGLGDVRVLNGKGILQDDVIDASGYPSLSATEPYPAWQKQWLPFERRLIRLVAGRARTRRRMPRCWARSPLTARS